MSYELTLQIYASAWVGVLGTLMLMVNWVGKKLEHLFGEYAKRLDRKNADLGLDKSVEADKIAWDYLLPWNLGHIERYLRRNSFSRSRYLEELAVDIGRPMWLVIYSGLFVGTLLLAFSGPIVYHLTGLSYAAEYLVAIYLLTGGNLAAYLLL